METQDKNSQKKQQYERPELRVIRLATEEVLGFGCKLAVGRTCQRSACELLGEQLSYGGVLIRAAVGRAAPRAYTIGLRIADICFSIRSPVPLADEFDEPAYGSFRAPLLETDAPAIVDVILHPGHMPDLAKLTRVFDCGSTWSLFRERGYRWIVSQPPSSASPMWAARIAPDFRSVHVMCGGPLMTTRAGEPAILNPVRYPLDQILLMYVLSRSHGALIHAAGARFGSRGLMFAGPSGSGKTTLTRLLRAAGHFDLLSDDRMVVRERGAAMRASGTPWPGEAGIAENSDTSLAGGVFLIHGPHNRIDRLPPERALERLLQVTSIPWYDREVVPQVLSFLEELVKRTPMYTFEFTPDGDAVKAIERFLSRDIGLT